MSRFSLPLLIVFLLGACSANEGGEAATGAEVGEDESLFATAASPEHESEEDWAVARSALSWGVEEGLGDLPMGERLARLGTHFVGVPYLPGTLEVPGPEGLVVRLTAFDCVTLVEHLIVLARLLPEAGEGELDAEDAFRRRYREELTLIRYRGGVLYGYPSRLHYFSEWIHDAAAKGILDDVTSDLGGVQDIRPIDFMSTHPDSYRQIREDSTNLLAIREIEERLNDTPRFFIPKEGIAHIEEGIQDGDVIAAVSTVAGLDIAHTGIAVRREGRVHLLHAPLVGDSVEISALPLAERIQGFSSQSGIVVARVR